MRNTLVFLVSILILSSCSKKIQYQSSYITSAIEVDGDISEWTANFNYNSDTKLAYAVVNDNENLYIAFKTLDETTIRKVAMFGMTTWIDTLAKKKETFGIKYPYRDKKPFERPTKEPNSKGFDKINMNKNINTSLNRFFKRNAKYMIYDGGSEPYILDPVTNPKIQASALLDTFGFLNYEIKIPLNVLYKDNFKSSKDKIISIGFVCEMPSNMMNGPMGGPERNSQGQHPGGVSPRGGMSPGEGMRPGPGGEMRPNMPQMSSMMEPTTLWLKRVLIPAKAK